MYTLDTDRLYRDVTKKRYKAKLSQNDVVREIDLSRSTFFRLSHDKDITMHTFLKLITWLDTDANRYIKQL